MKKILITAAVLFAALASTAQGLAGTWHFEKMNFFGKIIYFDDSKSDRDNLLRSWIKMNQAEDDPALQKEIMENKTLIYDIAKKVFKSDIEFKNIKYELYLEWTTGKLIYTSQKDGTETEKMEVDIIIEQDRNLEYKRITFPMFGDFHQSEMLSIALKDNKLVLEDIQEPGAGAIKPEHFIFYYERRSGDVYIPEVEIGDQVWMQRNLDVDRFRNGDWIPEARTAEEWKEASRNKTPAWCYVDYDELNNKKYGKMYNWYCIEDRRGLAPEGWHVPSLAEARVLINELGGDRTASHALRSKTGWRDNANSTNSSGFSANGAGKCWLDGTFMEKNFSAYFATRTKNKPDAEGRYQVNYFLVQQTSGTVYNNHSTFPGTGISIRCIKN